MNIDKPRCNFKNCRYCFDGNCINEVRREDCEYHQGKKMIELIMKAYQLCTLCTNDRCKNPETNTGDCNPRWNGEKL